MAMDTIPLFKTHYSIGKSILTLRDPSEVTLGGSESVIDISLDAGLKEVVLVEDNLHGLLEAKKRCEENNLNLVFGFRLTMCSEYVDEKDREAKKREQLHKVIIFAKNDAGIKKLYKIYSDAFCNHGGKLIDSDLKKHWSNKALLLAIPFYDSFLYMNNFKIGSRLMPDFSFCPMTFFIENNGLPFDGLLRNIVDDFAKESGTQTQAVKSIFYRHKEDFKAFQTFRIITNRAFTKRASISAPFLDNCASDRFCMESYLEL